MAKGFLQDAILSVLAFITIEDISLMYNSLLAVQYKESLGLFRWETFDTEEMQVFFGCTEDSARKICVEGFRRELPDYEHPHGIGVHFYKEPPGAIGRAEKVKAGQQLTLIVAKLLVSGMYELKPGEVVKLPVPKVPTFQRSCDGSSVPISLFYKSHVLRNKKKEIEIITANEDNQALPLFLIRGRVEPALKRKDPPHSIELKPS